MHGLSPADGVAAVHLTAIAFMLAGGLLSWRWPVLLWAHAPLAAAVLGVNLARADCPLTVLELRLREREGAPAYQDGFIGHYLVQPVHPEGITPTVQAVIYLVAVVPNVLAYGVLAARAVGWAEPWSGRWPARAHQLITGRSHASHTPAHAGRRRARGGAAARSGDGAGRRHDRRPGRVGRVGRTRRPGRG